MSTPPATGPDPVGGDAWDHRRAHGATGLLRTFNEAGVLEAVDVHVAQRLCASLGEGDERAALALALAVRAVRGGSVCVDLHTVADEVVLWTAVPDDEPVVVGDPGAESVEAADPAADPAADLPWPEAGSWYAAVRASALARPSEGGATVLRLLEDRLVYLDRYWREEQQVCDDLLARPPLDPSTDEESGALEAGLDRVFSQAGYDEQRAAARTALTQRTTVLTGGPGTGKTTTVAALLALLAEQAEVAGRPRPRIALAAPTGKAAARLQQAVEEELARLPASDRERVGRPQAVTLHRLLGSNPRSSTRFRHHRGDRLPHDVVVVDETSMVSLTLTARLLEAVRPTTRLILVGDPDQLTSVEAGAVLADLVAGLAGHEHLAVAALRTSHRYGDAIGELATAVRDGDADRALSLLRSGDEHLRLVEDPDPVPAVRELVLPRALDLVRAAAAGEAEAALHLLDQQRLLCAHREGSAGVRHWNRLVERWVAEETGEPVWATWYAGRPVLVTANDYGLGVHNGDAGVVVRDPHRGLRARVAAVPHALDLAPSRLGQVETMHALTIHKSQGSQADEVLVVLPPARSRLLTRELFYTAVTRARGRVVVVGAEAEVRAAIGRRAVRATGLRQRLGGAGPGVPG